MADAGGSAGGNVALLVSSEDLYESIQALFNSCKEDIKTSIAKSIADIKEYLTSLSPNNQGKTTLPSPDKADAARRSMKQIAKNVCLTPNEQKEFDRLIKSIENDLFAKYANALNRSWGGRRSRRKSRRSKSKKRSRK